MDMGKGLPRPGTLITILMVFYLGSSPVAARTAAAQTLPPRWILVYAGGVGRPSYSVHDFVHMMTALDTSGTPAKWLMTGAMFLDIRAASGRGFATWAIKPRANGADWEAYVDSLLGANGVITRLDSAVGLAEASIGALGHPYPVVVMIPYPDPAEDSMIFQGVTYQPSRGGDRLSLVHAYVDDVRSEFSKRRYRHVTLQAFYWLNEAIPTAADRVFLPSLSAVIHKEGFQFYWIPYYRSPGSDRWRSLGFDQAWYQPNYFFHLDVGMLRVDSAMRTADSLGLGIELEFDGRLLTSPAFASRLTPYIATLRLHPDLLSRPIALYDGGGGLLELAVTKDPRIRSIYDSLVAVLTSDPGASSLH